MVYKIAAVCLILFGEALAIAAELIASKRIVIEPEHSSSIFFSMFLLMTIGGALLVAGYMLGYVHLKNIWIVTAISIGSILIIEPLLTFLLLKQVPNLGATVGLIFGFLGIAASLVLH